MPEYISVTVPYEIRNSYISKNHFSVGKIPDDDKPMLINLYGESIRNIRQLNQDETFLFSGQDTISPDLVVQTLYKVRSAHEYPPDVVHAKRYYLSQSIAPIKGAITPVNFRQQLEKYISENPILRTNYYKNIFGEYWAVELNEQKPELSFHVLNVLDAKDLDNKLDSIMTADRHRQFNLTRKSLLRISVYRISFQEYAILITQPQLIANSWDPMAFLRELLPYDDLPEYVPAPYTSISQAFTQQGTKDRKLVLDYWKKNLAQLPPKPIICGYNPSQKSPSTRATLYKISQKETDIIRSKIVDSDRSFWIALLETAWGIMLQQFNESDDTHFPLLLPFRQAKLKNSTSADMHNALPMRVQCTPQETVRDLVKKQLVQLIGAQPIGRPTRQELANITGQNTNYNHIISFQGFWAESISYSQIPQSNVITQATMNVCDTGRDLAVYFRFNGKEIFIETLYNENSISEETIEATILQYHKVLTGMMENWNNPINKLKHKLESADIITHNSHKLSKDTIVSMLREISFFSELNDDSLYTLANSSHLYTSFSDDTILSIGEQQDNLIFVLGGKVARYMESSECWLNPLSVIKKNGLVNEYALTDTNSCIMAQVSTSKALLISIPVNTIRKLMVTNPTMIQKFNAYILDELKKYQKRWVNT